MFVFIQRKGVHWRMILSTHHIHTLYTLFIHINIYIYTQRYALGRNYRIIIHRLALFSAVGPLSLSIRCSQSPPPPRSRRTTASSSSRPALVRGETEGWVTGVSADTAGPAVTREGSRGRRCGGGGGAAIRTPKRIHSAGESAVRALFHGTPPLPTPLPAAVLCRHVSGAVYKLSSIVFLLALHPSPSVPPCHPPTVWAPHQVSTPDRGSTDLTDRGLRVPDDADVASTAVTTTSRRHEMQLAARRIRWMCLLCACALADQHVNTAANNGTQTGSTSIRPPRTHVAVPVPLGGTTLSRSSRSMTRPKALVYACMTDCVGAWVRAC